MTIPPLPELPMITHGSGTFVMKVTGGTIQITTTSVFIPDRPKATPGATQCASMWRSDQEHEHVCNREEGHPGVHTDWSGDFVWQV